MQASDLEESLKSLKDNYICPICTESLVDPVTRPCSHMFCELCNLKYNKAECPVCKNYMCTSHTIKCNKNINDTCRIIFGAEEYDKRVAEYNEIKECHFMIKQWKTSKEASDIIIAIRKHENENPSSSFRKWYDNRLFKNKINGINLSKHLSTEGVIMAVYTVWINYASNLCGSKFNNIPYLSGRNIPIMVKNGANETDLQIRGLAEGYNKEDTNTHWIKQRILEIEACDNYDCGPLVELWDKSPDQIMDEFVLKHMLELKKLFDWKDKIPTSIMNDSKKPNNNLNNFQSLLNALSGLGGGIGIGTIPIPIYNNQGEGGEYYEDEDYPDDMPPLEDGYGDDRMDEID